MAVAITATAGNLSGTNVSLATGQTQPWALSFWFRPDSTTNATPRTIFGQCTLDTNGWAVRQEGTVLRLRIAGQSAFQGISIPARATIDGMWVLISYISFGAGTGLMTSFVNGVIAQSESRAVALPDTTGLSSPVCVGGVGSSSRAEGAIAEIAFWRGVSLSGEQIADLARGVPANVVAPNGVVYWPLRGTSPISSPSYTGSSVSLLPVIANGIIRTWHPENAPPTVQPPAAPDLDLTAWVLELQHVTGTRYYATENLGTPQDVDIIGAATPAAIKNAAGLSVRESFSDGVGGLSVPSTVTLRISNTETPTVAQAIRPRNTAPQFWARLSDTLRDEVTGAALTPVGRSAVYVDGPAGGGDQAVTFTGAANSFHVTATGTAEHNLPASWTISFWVKRPTTPQGSRYVMSRGANWAILYGYVTNAVEFYSAGYSGSDPRTGTAITIPDADRWYHVAFTRDGPSGGWFGFLNGVQVWGTTRTFTITPISSGFPQLLFGGSSPSTNRFLGSLFDFAIHPIGMSAAEVAAIYRAGLGAEGFLPTIRYAGTPAFLRRYDRGTGVYQTLLSGLVTDQRAAPGEMQLSLSSYDEAALAEKVPKATVTIGNFPSGRDQSAPIPVVFGQAYLTPPHVGENPRELFTDYAIGFKDASIVDMFSDNTGGAGTMDRVSEWVGFEGVTITRTSTSQFTVTGDWTSEIPVGTALRWTLLAGGSGSARVTSRTYASSVTTFTVTPAILPESSIVYGIGADSIDEIEIAAAGTGYAVGDRINITGLGTFTHYAVTAVGTNGAVEAIRPVWRAFLAYAGDTYSTTTTGAGTGLTITVRAVSSNIQYLSASTETNRYAVENQFLTTLRLLGDVPGGLVVRARNQPENALFWDVSAVAAEVLGNTVWGLSQPIIGADFDVLTGVNINYALGGDRVQRSGRDLLRDLLAVKGCRLTWDARWRAWRYRVDATPTAPVETLGYADGEFNNIKGAPTLEPLSERDSVKNLVLRYGRNARVQSQDDALSYIAENDYQFELRREISNYGSDKVITAPHITDYANATRYLKYQGAIARGFKRQLVLQVGLVGHRVQVGDLVRVRIPLLNLDEIMRVIERTTRLGDAELRLIQYLPEAYATPTDDDFGFVDNFAQKFVTQDIGREDSASTIYGEDGNLILNPDFSLPLATAGSILTLPGWTVAIANGPTTSHLERATSKDYRGGAAVKLKTSTASVSMYPMLNLDPDAVDATVIASDRYTPWIFSVYASSPIGWNFTLDQGTSAMVLPPRILASDRNAAGWRRYYTVFSWKSDINFRIRIVVRSGNATGVQFDAAQLERGRHDRLYPSPWRRNPSTRIDPAVLGYGQLRVMSQLGLGTATAVEQVVREISTTSGNTYTATGIVPAGSFLLGITTRVATTVTLNASNTIRVGLTTGTTSEFGTTGSAASFPTGALLDSEDFSELWTPTYTAGVLSASVTTAGNFTGGKLQLIAHIIRLLGGQT